MKAKPKSADRSLLSIGSFVSVGSALSTVCRWSVMSWRSTKKVMSGS